MAYETVTTDEESEPYVSVHPNTFYFSSALVGDYDWLNPDEQNMKIEVDADAHRVRFTTTDEPADPSSGVYPVSQRSGTGFGLSAARALSRAGVKLDSTVRVMPESPEDGVLVVGLAKYA